MNGNDYRSSSGNGALNVRRKFQERLFQRGGRGDSRVGGREGGGRGGVHVGEEEDVGGVEERGVDRFGVACRRASLGHIYYLKKFKQLLKKKKKYKK